MRLRPISIRVLALGPLALVSLGLLAAPAAASDAGTLVSDTDALRASHGLAGYRTCADLDGIAQRWAAHLAGAGSLSHNPGLADEMAGWESLGENVGEGGSAAQVQTLFVQSPDHLANLVSTSYEEVGIGTARSGNGTLWVDEVFRRPSGAACAGVAAAPPPVSAPAPQVTSAPPAATPSRETSSATPAHRPAATTAPPTVTAAQVRARQLAAERTALRARLTTTGAPEGDVVGDALAFASLMRPVG